jgi:hypothetical protein
MNFSTQGDTLDSLPTDKVEPNNAEMKILNRLFNDEEFSEGGNDRFREVMLVSMVFFIISLPIVDRGIVSFFPSCQNEYISLLVKTAIFALFYFVARQAFLT